MNGSAIIYSCVIPIFNESDNIHTLYERLKAVMDKLGSRYEIIFIDDGSADNSYQILKGIAFSDRNVKALSFVRNFGQHNAVIAGFIEAAGDYMITMDADLQNPPEELPLLIEKLSEGFDIVSGFRIIRKDTVIRRFCSLLANLIIAARTGLRMKDYGSMFRIFRRRTAKELVNEFEKSRGYITMLMTRVTRNIAEVGVKHDGRYSGDSKYNIRRLFSVFLRVLFCYGEILPTLSEEKGVKPLFIIEKRVKNGKETILTAKDR